MIRIAIFSLFGICLCTAITVAQKPTPVSYDVDLTDANSHYVKISLTAESTGPQTEIMMATWTPGSYLIREYARNIDQISAANEKGEKLAIAKISKNRWRIETGENKMFTVEYRVYCRERSVRTNFVNADYAVLNGAPTFVTVPEFLDRPHQVSLKLPESWKRSSTSLKPNSDSAHSYVASNFDELVDSPIVAGRMAVYPFKVANKTHQLVNVNELGYWNGSKAARDLAKIVAEHHKLWGNVPYEDYRFLNVIAGGGGGLEHDNSCMLITGRWTSVEDSSYKRWLSLASHEFFHAWNVRRLRPRALAKYDYENEAYVPSLWIAEGVTTYYQDLVLARAGFKKEKDFISSLSSGISRLQKSNGRKKQSLTESSHDAWIKFYRPGENTRYTTISYYSKGAIVACLLDAKIRLASKAKFSLDDAMRKLYENHAEEKGGYLPEDFRKICGELAGEDMSAWFTSAVDSTDELDYQVLCDCYGLQIGELKPQELKPDDKAKKDSKAEVKTADGKTVPAVPKKEKEKKPGETWLGVNSGSNGVVSSIEADSPASRIRLGIGDELIALDNMRIRGDLTTRLKRLKPGDTIQLLVARDDQLETIGVTLEEKPNRKTWTVSIHKNATDEQNARRNAWLGIEATPEKKPDNSPAKK